MSRTLYLIESVARDSDGDVIATRLAWADSEREALELFLAHLREEYGPHDGTEEYEKWLVWGTVPTILDKHTDPEVLEWIGLEDFNCGWDEVERCWKVMP